MGVTASTLALISLKRRRRQVSIPIEILEIILTFVWHGSLGSPGGGSLQASRLVNRTWHLVSHRVMMSFVYLEFLEDFIRYYRVIGGDAKQVLGSNRIFSPLRAGKIKNFGGKTNVALMHVANARYLCRHLDCTVRLNRPFSGDDMASLNYLQDILPHLPNLRYFTFVATHIDSRVNNILEQLADRDSSLEYANEDEKQTRANRQKLETVDLWLQSYPKSEVYIRPGLSYGIRHLSLNMTSPLSTGCILSHCRPGTLETLRFACSLDLSAPVLAYPLAKLTQFPSAPITLVLNRHIEYAPHFSSYNVPMLLKGHPMPGLGRIILEVDPGVRLDLSHRVRVSQVGAPASEDQTDINIQPWNEIVGSMPGSREIVQACRRFKIPFDTSQPSRSPSFVKRNRFLFMVR